MSGSDASDLIVRPSAAPTDAETIVDFNAGMAHETEGLSLDLAVLSAGVRAGLADPGKAIYFVAESRGRVVGQLMITHEWSDWRNGDIWWVQSVYVTAHRRRGIFRASTPTPAGRPRRRGPWGSGFMSNRTIQLRRG